MLNCPQAGWVVAAAAVGRSHSTLNRRTVAVIDYEQNHKHWGSGFCRSRFRKNPNACLVRLEKFWHYLVLDYFGIQPCSMKHANGYNVEEKTFLFDKMSWIYFTATSVSCRMSESTVFGGVVALVWLQVCVSEFSVFPSLVEPPRTFSSSPVWYFSAAFSVSLPGPPH